MLLAIVSGIAGMVVLAIISCAIIVAFLLFAQAFIWLDDEFGTGATVVLIIIGAGSLMGVGMYYNEPEMFELPTQQENPTKVTRHAPNP